MYDFSYDKELETKLTKNTKILKSKINSNIAYHNKYIFFINNKNKLQLFNYNL